MTEIGYEEDGSTFIGGDAGDEASWVPSWSYSPPGEAAPLDEFNYDDSGQVWGPGDESPLDLGEFSSMSETGPSEADQVRALTDYVAQSIGGYREQTPEELAAEQAAFDASNNFGPGQTRPNTGARRPEAGRQIWEYTTTPDESNNWGGWGPPPPGWEQNSLPWPPPGEPPSTWDSDVDTRMAASRAEAGPDVPSPLDKPFAIRGDPQRGGTAVSSDQMRRELQRAGFPDALTASPETIASVYARTAAGAGAVTPPRTTARPTGTSLADFQRYVDSVIASNNRRYDDERKDKDNANARADRQQKLAIIQELLRMSTGPNGPQNRAMALAMIEALGTLTDAEKAMFQGARATRPKRPTIKSILAGSGAVA